MSSASPSEKPIRDLLRGLASRKPAEAPVLSIYLDMRPHGDRPQLRASQLMLMDRLRQIEKTYLPRGAALDSFRKDVERIEQYLDHAFPPEVQGVAIFASSADGLFEVVESGVPFEHQVSVGRVPDLLQLARLLDDQETAVVAVVDSRTVRLFVVRTGSLEEAGGLSDASTHYNRTRLGGLNQARYQRHIDKHRTDFAREAASEIERLVEREGASRLILAGNVVALPLLRDALSPRVLERVHGNVVGVDPRSTHDVIAEGIAPILAEAEAASEQSIADELIAEVQKGGLGVVGYEYTRTALEHGQGDVLVLTAVSELTDEQRNTLVRLAVTTGAEVEVVAQHPELQRLGGVGALLRYQHDAPLSTARDADAELTTS